MSQSAVVRMTNAGLQPFQAALREYRRAHSTEDAPDVLVKQVVEAWFHGNFQLATSKDSQQAGFVSMRRRTSFAGLRESVSAAAGLCRVVRTDPTVHRMIHARSVSANG